jgi:hypothetical protein
MRRDEILRALAAQLHLSTAEEVLDLVEQVGHPRLLTPQVELFVRAVMDGTDPHDG